MAGRIPRDGPPPLFGAVLCGGASQRMGTNKALLELDGEPLAGRVAGVLRIAGAKTVVAVGGDPEELAATNLEVIADSEPGGGPLVGVVSGLDYFQSLASAHSASEGSAGGAAAPSPADDFIAVFSACDLPFVSPPAVTSLVNAVVDGAMAAVAEVDNHAQWHLLALGGSAREPLGAALAAGERSLRGAVGPLEPVRVSLAPQVAADVDTPEEWRAAQQRHIG